MPAGVVVLILVVVAAGAFGLYHARTDGRLRATTTPTDPQRVGGAEVGAALGERATFVQFSSAFCAPCRATRQLLSGAVAGVDGVVHIEIDAESQLDLVRRLDVRRTPTVVVLDPDGRVLSRVTGVPRRDEVQAALNALPLHRP